MIKDLEKQHRSGVRQRRRDKSKITLSRRDTLIAAGSAATFVFPLSSLASTQTIAGKSCGDPAEITRRVTTMIVDHLGIPEAKVTLDSEYEKDFGADSLDLVQLVMDYEAEFGTRIPDDDAEQMVSVRDTVDYLCRKADA